MRCLDAQFELESYVDRDLSPERAALLEMHLACCEACRTELACLREVDAALGSWPLVAESAGLTGRIMARVAPRLVITAEPPAIPAFRIRWSDLAISVAGATAVFALMLLVNRLMVSSQVQLIRPQIVLQSELLRLEALLWIQRLIRSGVVMWGLLIAAVAFAVALVPALSGLVVRRQNPTAVR